MKTILITGANRGLGFELARQLSEKGHNILLTGRRIELVRAAAKKIGAVPIELDVGNKESIQSLPERLSVDSIDVLVHNAAVLHDDDRKGTIMETNWEVIENTMSINAVGPILLTQVLSNYLRSGSRIINIGARPALFRNLDRMSGMAIYRISKAAFHAWSIILSREMKDRGVIVTTLHPGWVRTDMGGPNATRSVKEGVDTALWLIEEAPDSVHGKFYLDREEIDW